jgi:hypothetical protein
MPKLFIVWMCVFPAVMIVACESPAAPPADSPAQDASASGVPAAAAPGIALPPHFTAPTVPPSEQWMSHQMNQPPPGSERYVHSDERLGDLKRLYEEAKSELDRKTPGR